MLCSNLYAELAETNQKTESNWLTIGYFFPILCACKFTSSLRFAHTSSYRNCETAYSFEVLTIATKNSMLHVAGFQDLSLVTETIDLS